jgi:serine protease AprX
MKSLNSLLILLLFCLIGLQEYAFSGTDRYWIYFTDKGNLEKLSISEQQDIVKNMVSPKAIKRRQIRANQTAFNKISISQDLPVYSDYIKTVRQRGFTIHQKSRWFNGVSGNASREVLDQISKLPFVKSVEVVKRFVEKNEAKDSFDELLLLEQYFQNYDLNYGASFTQADFHSIPEVHQLGLTGEGVLIGVFDTGFDLNHPAMQHLIQKVVAEWDFVNNDSITHNEEGDPGVQDWHGSWVLSVIAGMKSGQLIGPAFNASFCLAKTDAVDFERNIEEDNWAAAAEWAEAIGVDIVSTSVGYNIFDEGQSSYSYSDMDGETTIVTQAANYLADRGVVVVSSAGNEGDDDWFYIDAPADGQQVLAVGAVNSSNQIASFSSHGPTADGRIKPDVMGMGVNVRVAYPATQGYTTKSGTSMSCPIIAGICALVLEKFPDLSVSAMLEVMRRAGDNWGNPNNSRGWGKVDAVKALQLAENGFEEVNYFSVLPNINNPISFNNGYTEFRIAVPGQSPVTISIYDILGQRVKKIEFFSGGGVISPVFWDGTNENGVPLSSGIYPFRVQTNFGRVGSKVMIIR